MNATTTSPAALEGLTLEKMGGSVRLSWNEYSNADGETADRYRLNWGPLDTAASGDAQYRRIRESRATKAQDDICDADGLCAMNIIGLTNGTAYGFWVFATYAGQGGGHAAETEPRTETPELLELKGLTLSGTADGKLLVEWASGPSGTQHYHVRWKETGSIGWQGIMLDKDERSVELGGITLGHDVSVEAEALVARNPSIVAARAEGETSAHIAVSASAEARTGTLHVAWEVPDDVDLRNDWGVNRWSITCKPTDPAHGSGGGNINPPADHDHTLPVLPIVEHQVTIKGLTSDNRVVAMGSATGTPNPLPTAPAIVPLGAVTTTTVAAEFPAVPYDPENPDNPEAGPSVPPGIRVEWELPAGVAANDVSVWRVCVDGLCYPNNTVSSGSTLRVVWIGCTEDANEICDPGEHVVSPNHPIQMNTCHEIEVTALNQHEQVLTQGTGEGWVLDHNGNPPACAPAPPADEEEEAEPGGSGNNVGGGGDSGGGGNSGNTYTPPTSNYVPQSASQPTPAPQPAPKLAIETIDLSLSSQTTLLREVVTATIALSTSAGAAIDDTVMIDVSGDLNLRVLDVDLEAGVASTNGEVTVSFEVVGGGGSSTITAMVGDDDDPVTASA